MDAPYGMIINVLNAQKDGILINKEFVDQSVINAQHGVKMVIVKHVMVVMSCQITIV